MPKGNITISFVHNELPDAVNIKCVWGTEYFPSPSLHIDKGTHANVRNELKEALETMLDNAIDGFIDLDSDGGWFARIEDLARIIARGTNINLMCCCKDETTGAINNPVCHADVLKDAILELAEYLPEPTLPEGGAFCDLIVAGGRGFNNVELMEETVMFLVDSGLIAEDTHLVCGEAKGADLMAATIWQELDQDVDSYPAMWEDLLTQPVKIKARPDGSEYNVLAGFNRNAEMARIADGLLAYWNGVTTGTEDMIKRMVKQNKPVIVCLYNCGMNQEDIQADILAMYPKGDISFIV